MATVWLTEEELKLRFGEARVDGLADRDGDNLPDAGVIEAAILDAEGRVASELVGQRYAAADLPSAPADASSTLKRMVARLAFYNLEAGRNDVVSAFADRQRDDALSELRAVKAGGQSLRLAEAPAVDSSPGTINVARRPSSALDKPLTLANDSLGGMGHRW